VGKDQVSQAFDNAAETYGFALDDDARLPAQSMAKRLEKSLSNMALVMASACCCQRYYLEEYPVAG
jgi:hypothetical protein